MPEVHLCVMYIGRHMVQWQALLPHSKNKDPPIQLFLSWYRFWCLNSGYLQILSTNLTPLFLFYFTNLKIMMWYDENMIPDVVVSLKTANCERILPLHWQKNVEVHEMQAWMCVNGWLSILVKILSCFLASVNWERLQPPRYPAQNEQVRRISVGFTFLVSRCLVSSFSVCVAWIWALALFYSY